MNLAALKHQSVVEKPFDQFCETSLKFADTKLK